MSDTASQEFGPTTLTGIKRGEPKQQAAGMPAVTKALEKVYGQSGVNRGTRALLKLNQKGGFDCPSCAWPDPDDHRAMAEFCENGAKAVASETTLARADREFFASHSITEMLAQSDYWHEQQGRLTEPMILREGATHYEPISWDDALARIAGHLNALESPDDASFYTSGRASNEAAYLYQLFARQFGTNNLPDCSNMCHESSGAALGMTIGIGKGTVTLEDIYQTEAIFLLGQNPGTNHPRMLTALETCVQNGGKIVAVNPLKEAGMLAFAHPQKVSGFFNKATPLAHLYLQVNINGDQAFLKGLGKEVLERPERIDQAFIEQHTTGYEEYVASLKETNWDDIVRLSGLARKQIKEAADILIGSQTAIFCWAMGLTQHVNAVATIQEIVNLQLMLGNLGKPGAGLCPVRGHSNVQGDRTMGVWEMMPDSFLDALGKEFDFEPPRKHGYDTVASIRAMHAKAGQVFIALGGNFLSATPDTAYTAEALRNCRLTVQISTKLNRSHLITGREAIILPCLGRSEVDERATGPQFISMENSMGIVHTSQGKLKPASVQLRSEPAIVAGMAEAVLGDKTRVPWATFREDYGKIRDSVERVIPGFANFNRRLREEGGFYLRNPAKELDFAKIGGRAKFTAHELTAFERDSEDELILMTLRSHDQFNTTVYGLDDRYRGIENERRVIFMNPADMEARGLSAEQPVDITSQSISGTREVRLFLAVPYDIPRGAAAAYFPECNVLVPIDSTAEISNTPTSKSVRVTVKPSAVTQHESQQAIHQG